MKMFKLAVPLALLVTSTTFAQTGPIDLKSHCFIEVLPSDGTDKTGKSERILTASVNTDNGGAVEMVTSYSGFNELKTPSSYVIVQTSGDIKTRIDLTAPGAPKL